MKKLTTIYIIMFLIISYQRAIFRNQTFVMIEKVEAFFETHINDYSLNYIVQIVIIIALDFI